MDKPKCDVCGCTSFTHKPTNPQRSENVPASQYFKVSIQPQISDCVLRFTTFDAVCDNCGECYAYTRQG
jgi:hypothetical protein